MDAQARETLVGLSAVVADRYARAAEGVERAVTPAQLGMIVQLRQRGVATVSTLAEASAVSVSTASRWADRLQGLGLITRSPAELDRRETALGLTALGRGLARRWDNARVAVWQEVLAPLADDDRDRLLRSLADFAGPGASIDAPDHPEGQAPALPTTADAVWTLQRRLAAASADVAPDVVVDFVRTAVHATECVLRVLTFDGRFLHAAAWADAATGASRDDAARPSDETVDRGAAGTALRSGEPVVEDLGTRSVAHVPLTGEGRLGVLSLTFEVEPTPELVDLLCAVAQTAAARLDEAAVASRRLYLAARTRAWTIGAEMQARQLGPRRTVTHGVHVAAHVEPSYDGCTDSHDTEVLHRDGTTMVDVAVLDVTVDRYTAPLVTGLALAALRHARTAGRGPADQAAMVDEAVFRHFRGEATVALLLLRLTLEPWSVEVVASGGVDLLTYAEGVSRVRLRRGDPAGLTGETAYRTSRLDIRRSARLVVLGDGFAKDTPAGRRAEDIAGRSRDLSPDEVVRLVTADLLDRTRENGPPEDATIVCVDT